MIKNIGVFRNIRDIQVFRDNRNIRDIKHTRVISHIENFRHIRDKGITTRARNAKIIMEIRDTRDIRV